MSERTHKTSKHHRHRCNCLCVYVISERRLQPHELPHNIYIQNYSTATATCLTLRRWLFSLTREATLNSNERALQFLFWQVRGCCQLYSASSASHHVGAMCTTVKRTQYNVYLRIEEFLLWTVFNISVTHLGICVLCSLG